jgi:hypothetical protein
MTSSGYVRVVVDLDVGSDTIRGSLDDGAGPPIEFTGWLELMSGFETVRERAGAGPARELPGAG